MLNPDSAQSNSVGQLLSRATEAKNKGNEAAKVGQWSQASFHYKHVNLFIGSLGSQYRTCAGNSEMMGTLDLIGGGRTSHRLPLPTAPEQSIIDELLATANSNLAQAHLHLNRAAKAVEASTTSIAYWDALSPPLSSSQTQIPGAGKVKAMYRRGVAYLMMGAAAEARTDLEVVQTMSGDADSGIAQRMAELVQLEEANRAKEKKMYQKMFA